MKKRLFAFLLTFCLLLSAWSGFSVLALDSATSEDVSLPVTEEPISGDNTFNKIHFYFDTAKHAFIDDMAELQSATASVKSDYAAAIMMAEGTEPADENVYITVQFASDYMSDKTYLSLKAAREEAKTAIERDMAKTRQNAYSKSYHAAIVEENLPLLSAIPYTDANAIGYSPFVTLTVPAALLDTAVLAEVAENANILHISLTDGFEAQAMDEVDGGGFDWEKAPKTDWGDVLECIGATGLVQNGADTEVGINNGAGMKVGIYEQSRSWFDVDNVLRFTLNKCDKTHANLSYLFEDEENPQMIFRPGDEANNGCEWGFTHATKVASVLVKMLPAATFYFANNESSLWDGLRIEGVSWFIEQGCDIVNCSFGYTSCQQYRYDIDAVYDYQIESTGIIVVFAAGNVDNTDNTGTPNIASPGLAYNVITVGGVFYDSSAWVHTDEACYLDPGGRIKPNISAPYAMNIENLGVIWGTSLSAPLVTACITILQQHVIENISTRYSWERIVPIVMATAQKTGDYTAANGIYECADDKVGAGIINLARMLSAGNNTVINASGNDSAVVYSRSVTLSAGKEICIAASWLVEATSVPIEYPGGSVTIPDYNLYLNTVSGTVAVSTYTENNVEYIRYTVPKNVSTQTYTILLVRMETVSQPKQIGIAYYYK